MARTTVAQTPATGTNPMPDPAIALAGRLGRINAQLYDDPPDDESEIDALFVERETVEAAIIAAPPRTIAGVAALLEVIRARGEDVGQLPNDAALIASAREGLEIVQLREKLS